VRPLENILDDAARIGCKLEAATSNRRIKFVSLAIEFQFESHVLASSDPRLFHNLAGRIPTEGYTSK
jgi:hypothetical protein